MFSYSSGLFEYSSSIPPEIDDEEKKIYPKHKKDLNIGDHRKLFISFTMILKIFEEYCSSSGIELFWSTWNSYDLKNLEKLCLVY